MTFRTGGGSGYAALTRDLVSSLKSHKIPFVKATKKNIAPYGEILTGKSQVLSTFKNETWPATGWREISPNTGNEAKVTTGSFSHWWNQENNICYAKNLAVKGFYQTAIRVENSIFIRELNYHPCGPQCLYPEDSLNTGQYIMLLGRTKNNIHIDDISLSDFVAFLMNGNEGVKIYPNTWHQPSFPLKLSDEIVHFNAQSSVHACVVFDSINEHNCLLRFDLDDLIQE